MAVKICWDEQESVTREGDPNDRWDRDDTQTTISDIRGLWVEDEPEEVIWGNSTVVNGFNPGDVCYAVIAQFSTGDTFGQDAGAETQVLGVFANPATAKSLAREAEKFGTVPASGGQPLINRYEFIFEGQKIHIGWTGYFESLDQIIVKELVVRNG